MVADLKLKGGYGTNGLMFVPYYGRYPRAFIGNYSSWKQYHSQGKIAEVASSLLSHESLHLTINKFSLRASESLDNLFGRSDNWETYHHGLGDLDRLQMDFHGRTYRKNARTLKRRVRSRIR